MQSRFDNLEGGAAKTLSEFPVRQEQSLKSPDSNSTPRSVKCPIAYATPSRRTYLDSVLNIFIVSNLATILSHNNIAPLTNDLNFTNDLTLTTAPTLPTKPPLQNLNPPLQPQILPLNPPPPPHHPQLPQPTPLSLKTPILPFNTPILPLKTLLSTLPSKTSLSNALFSTPNALFSLANSLACPLTTSTLSTSSPISFSSLALYMCASWM
ncbi:hypothetical protein Vi05172_g8815 [Venturia inaequalis]|nr:hypothetical protein Vi05172_g8815 [Venturia inaequalis]